MIASFKNILLFKVNLTDIVKNIKAGEIFAGFYKLYLKRQQSLTVADFKELRI